MDSSCVEIQGQMDIDKKRKSYSPFQAARLKNSSQKTSITAFGLNCSTAIIQPISRHISYEQYYSGNPAILAFRTSPRSFCRSCLSDGQTRVRTACQIKKQKADDMFTHLARSVNSVYAIQKQEFTEAIIKPQF